ncbi:MAG: hypothetical protein ACR2PY_02410 [Salinispira sp.]
MLNLTYQFLQECSDIQGLYFNKGLARGNEPAIAEELDDEISAE